MGDRELSVSTALHGLVSIVSPLPVPCGISVTVCKGVASLGVGGPLSSDSTGFGESICFCATTGEFGGTGVGDANVRDSKDASSDTVAGSIAVSEWSGGERTMAFTGWVSSEDPEQTLRAVLPCINVMSAGGRRPSFLGGMVLGVSDPNTCGDLFNGVHSCCEQSDWSYFPDEDVTASVSPSFCVGLGQGGITDGEACAGLPPCLACNAPDLDIAGHRSSSLAVYRESVMDWNSNDRDFLGTELNLQSVLSCVPR